MAAAMNYQQLPGPGDPAPVMPQPGGRRYSRVRMFLSLFLTGCLITAAWVLSRPAIYETSARVLLTPVESPGGGTPDLAELSITQMQLLTSQPLVAEALAQLPRSGDPAGNLEKARALLSAAAVGGSGVLELRGTGEDPDYLTSLVNAVVDVFLKRSADIYTRNADVEQAETLEEMRQLSGHVENKRAELEAFRKEHDIVSMQREENRALANLKGLNKALDKANEAEVATRAHLKAVRDSRKDGAPLVRWQDQAALDSLEARLVEHNEMMEERRERFTATYMGFDSDTAVLQRKIDMLEKKIADKRNESMDAALAEAEQNWQQAHAEVARIKQQLDENATLASEFSNRFAEHEALVAELEQLEFNYQSRHTRQIELDIGSGDRPVNLQVLERAQRPIQPLDQHTTRDTAIGLGGSLFIALFGVLLVEFLRRPEPAPAPVPPPFWPGGIAIGGPAPDPMLARDETALLSAASAPPRELDPAEVRALVDIANPEARQVVLALLSGVDAGELADVDWASLDEQTGMAPIDGANPRSLKIHHLLVESLATAPDKLSGMGDAAAVDSLVRCLAFDARLTDPNSVDAEALRHTYITYLVRQGARLTDLHLIVGHIPADSLSFLAGLSPDAPSQPLAGINLIYPLTD